jgi:hypothetical protein
VKGYVLYRCSPTLTSPLVRHDREARDRLALVSSLEELVPVDAELGGLVIDEGDAWEARVEPVRPVEAQPEPGLAPVIPLFGLPPLSDRAARRARASDSGLRGPRR